MISTTMTSYDSHSSAKSDQYHPLKTSKTAASHEDYQDPEYYRQLTTTSSPRVRVYHDTNLNIESSSPVDFRFLMEDIAVQHNSQIKQESGRGKLEKHWTEVAGRVCIPEKWDQENFLKDWMDSSFFDSLLNPNGVVSAREALVAERQRENGRRCLKMTDQNGEQVLSFLT